MADVLLLEPNRLLARSYCQALTAAGHRPHWQTDAQTALGILEEHDIALVVLELELAAHNGVEFLYELRSYPDWDHIPVILHTMVASSHPGLGRVFWQELGIVGYQYKPQTSLEQLVGRVNRQLSPQAA